MGRSRAQRNVTGLENIVSQLKTWALLSFLLGITWASGLLIQDNLEEFSYVFVILNASQGITLFIHTVLMNDIVMLELKIRLGLVDQVELAIDQSRSRITASKSFKGDISRLFGMKTPFNRFQCLKATYPYDLKNQRKARNAQSTKWFFMA